MPRFLQTDMKLNSSSSPRLSKTPNGKFIMERRYHREVLYGQSTTKFVFVKRDLVLRKSISLARHLPCILGEKKLQSGWGFVRNSFSVGCPGASFALNVDKLCGKLKKLNRKGLIKRGRQSGGKIMREKCMR